MAKDQALQFILRVNEDTALQRKLEVVSSDHIEGIVQVAHEAGYEFTTAEFQAVAFEQWEASHSTAMSEDELDTVAGGQGNINFPPSPAIKFWSPQGNFLPNSVDSAKKY